MTTGTTKPKARQRYTEFVKERLGKELGQTNSRERSHALIRFYIEEIHNPIRTSISPEDTEIGLVDGPGDLGADFIHKDDNVVTIIQAKYLQRGDSVPQEDVENFLSIFMRITDPLYARHNHLDDVLSQIDYARDSFHCVFVCLGSIAGQAAVQSTQDPVIPTHVQSLGDRIDYEFLDETGLNTSFRNALLFSTGIPDECTLVAAGETGHRASVAQIVASDRTTYILPVGAKQLVDLYNRFRDSLFTLNIRNFIGNTITNRKMISTATDESAMFFLYNNGISCLATHVRVAETGDRLSAEGIQIINGAQTVRSLVRAAGRTSSFMGIDEPMVLVRITEVPDGYHEDGRFRTEIIRYNNTQNVIKASDFRSNDPVHAALRRQFSQIQRGGKKVEYIAKRTDHTRSHQVVVRMEDFAKVVYSFLGDPVSFSGSTSFLFDDSDGGGYSVIYGDGNAVWDSMPEDEFRLRAAIWWLGTKIGERLGQEKQELAASEGATGSASDEDGIRLLQRAALERKWMVIYAARLILENSYGDDYASCLRRFYKAEWEWGDGPIGMWFDTIYDRAKRSVIYVYRQCSHKDGFTPRNWMRSKSTPRELRDFVTVAMEKLGPPPGAH